MDQILLDTNAYLRLALKINPLLNTPFGENRCRLFVIKEFELEFTRSRRLSSEFAWVAEQPFVLNRKRSIRMARDKRRLLSPTKSVLGGYVRDEGLDVSPVDCSALAFGKVLGVPVVTDDQGMRSVAHEFAITTMRTLALLKLMNQAEHIDLQTVRDVVLHWIDTNDCPGRFRADYRRIFKENPPSRPKA